MVFVAVVFVLDLQRDLGRFAWLCWGCVLGALLSDVGYVRAAVRVWPLLEAAFDWQRVVQLLQPDRGE